MEPLGYRSTALHSAERREDEGFKEELRIMGSIKNRRSGSEAMRGRAGHGWEIVEGYISVQKGLEKAGAARGAREDERGGCIPKSRH